MTTKKWKTRRRPKQHVSPLPRFPDPKVTEFVQAERCARRILGPTGAVRFISSKRKNKYAVGQLFRDDPRDEASPLLFGVVGEGATWDAALLEAEKRVRHFKADTEDDARSSKVEAK